MIDSKTMEPKLVAEILKDLKSGNTTPNCTPFKIGKQQVTFCTFPTNKSGKDDKKIIQKVQKVQSSFEKLEGLRGVKFIFVPDTIDIHFNLDLNSIPTLHITQEFACEPVYQKRIKTQIKKLEEKLQLLVS